MNNPLEGNRTVLDSRDIIEYKEYLESEILYRWNDYLEDHNMYQEEEDQVDPTVSDIEDVDLDLEGFRERFADEIEEYEGIKGLVEENEGYGDFSYGETLIHRDYFVEYCKELCEDIGVIPRDLPGYIESNIDWQGVADDLEMDYTSIWYDGEFLMRS